MLRVYLQRMMSTKPSESFGPNDIAGRVLKLLQLGADGKQRTGGGYDALLSLCSIGK